MLNTIKNNLHWIFYFVSIIGYVFFISLNVSQIQLNSDPLYFSIIVLIAVLYIWIALAIAINRFTIKSCLYTTSLTGVIVALTVLVLYGVIPELGATSGRVSLTPYPNILAYVFFMIFIFSLPFIFYQVKQISNPSVNFTNNEETVNINPDDLHLESKKDLIFQGGNQEKCNQNIDYQNWEEASNEDLDSGEYEQI